MQCGKCNHRSIAMQKNKNATHMCNHRLFQESREEGRLNVFEMLGSWSMIYTFVKNLNACEGARRKASSEETIANAKA